MEQRSEELERRTTLLLLRAVSIPALDRQSCERDYNAKSNPADSVVNSDYTNPPISLRVTSGALENHLTNTGAEFYLTISLYCLGRRFKISGSSWTLVSTLSSSSFLTPFPVCVSVMMAQMGFDTI